VNDESRRPVHTRTITIDVFRAADSELEVTGRLVDERPDAQPTWFDVPQGSTIHDMSVTLRVRHPDLTITAASGTMTEHPYTICPDALPAIDRLVGLSVAQGFTRAVNERLGRQRGCSHMTALIQAMGPAIKQGAGAAFHEENGFPAPDADLWFINTCQAWRDGGPLVKGLRAGDTEALKALRARGPAPAGATEETDAV
jgi:DUF2889 family protein